ncbi:MAG: hypothetical protein M0Q94_05735 [Candidatus Cloacimonetes bacterium]|nr:hypothetical protein [Candidatus Cloacimonadota bacterium]
MLLQIIGAQTGGHKGAKNGVTGILIILIEQSFFPFIIIIQLSGNEPQTLLVKASTFFLGTTI